MIILSISPANKCVNSYFLINLIENIKYINYANLCCYDILKEKIGARYARMR